MSAQPPSWSPEPASATVLAEYLQRVSPQFVAAELDKLGLLNAADEAAAMMLGRVTALRVAPTRARASLWMMALAMCAMVVVVAEIRHFGPPDDDGGRFMQLAGPTPEW